MISRNKILILVILLLITGRSVGFSTSPTPIENSPKHDFFHTFNGDLPASLAAAKKGDQFGLVLFFGTQHCRFCHRMKTTVFTKPSVQQFYRQHFQILDIDIESDRQIILFNKQLSTYQHLAKNSRVRLTPTIVFINLEGEPVYKHIGIIADSQEFIWLGEYVLSGETAKQNFASFKMYKRRNSTL